MGEGGNQQTHLHEQKINLGLVDTGARNLPPSNMILELGGFFLDLIAGEASDNPGARGTGFSNQPMSLGGHVEFVKLSWACVGSRVALWPMHRL